MNKKIHLEVIKQMLALSTAGLGLVSALAWNQVITEFVDTQIKPFLPLGSGLISLLIYAVIVTILAVIVTLQLSRVQARLESNNHTPGV